MSENQLNKRTVISELTKSPHGDLAQYVPIGVRAGFEDPAFFSHLIAWNERKGSIRDSRVALPVLALTVDAIWSDRELRDNAMAHLAKLAPRDLLRAVEFSRSAPAKLGSSRQKALRGLVESYLRDVEASQGGFERRAIQHRKTLKGLYAGCRIKPGPFAQRVLFDGEKVGLFQHVSALRTMSVEEAAGTITNLRIPFLVARGAVGKRASEPAILQALVQNMTPTELVTNAKALEKLGVRDLPATRGAFEGAVVKASKSANVQATLKTTRAADMIGGDTGERLRGLQEKQLDKLAVEGDWAVFGDRSGSMQQSIELAKEIAATLARTVNGKVHLVFFSSDVQSFDVTGKSFDEIREITKRVVPGGGTAMGLPVAYLAERKISVDGMVFVSDGGERGNPQFPTFYKRYVEDMDVEPTVYLYKVRGSDPDWLSQYCARDGVDLQVFDLTGPTDSYSLPALITTMRASRFSLIDEIMGTPLLRIEDVLKKTEFAKAA